MPSDEATDELTDDEHRQRATEMYERWQAGEPKSRLDADYWDSPESHGKKFSGYVKKWLGVSTERQSAQTVLIARLQALLRANGISPGDAGDLGEEYRLLAKSRESALEAVRLYNDPVAGFRTEAFIMLMVIAWNSLFQAILERDNVDYYDRDRDGAQRMADGQRPKVLETWALAGLAIPAPEKKAVRANLNFFIGLRNQIAHRYLPAVDLAVVSESQALLLNFENLLVEQFGEEAGLGDQLAVPLQLSGFRNMEGLKSLRKAQAQLPTDVADFLDRHRDEVPEDVLNSTDYALQVFLIATTANRERSADAVVRFFKSGDLSAEATAELQQLAVIEKPRRVDVASGDLRATEVVDLVAERLPFRFKMHAHTACWKYFGIRPSPGSGEPEATNPDFCRYERLSGGYGYTDAWVEKLVRELSDAAVYEQVLGVRPDRR